MKQLNLKVSAREQNGSSASQRIRKSGNIPAVLYGPNGTRTLSIESSEFRKLWKQVSGRTALIELVEEGAENNALSIIQEIQRNPRTDDFVHIDFKEILRGRDMFATISIHVKGDAYGVRTEGGLIEQHRHDVAIRCRPRHLPEFVEVDVTEMKVGDTIKIKELPALEGVTYLTDGDVDVVSCVAAKVEEEAPAAEEAAAAPAAAAPAKKGK